MIRRIALAAALVAGTVTIPAHTDAYAGQCTKYEPLLRQQAPRGGWDVNRMSYYMWRESRCLPWVENVGRTTVAVGLLQVHTVTFPWLSMKTGVPTWRMRAWLKDPVNNVRAAALLSDFARRAWGDRYQPWRVR